ncbi:TonB-dependent receptor [Undibacterium terreum]|uniref:TonB-dependent receptor n=1 Tax=Undibacterium terreum TaxID=1224302 RepID=A0A916UPF8_9BURK|nr:TonB-dependent receptor [Undibacterium terreum]GGC78586.1 TonB-dependent receptor [Undibacterium terreum]
MNPLSPSLRASAQTRACFTLSAAATAVAAAFPLLACAQSEPQPQATVAAAGNDSTQQTSDSQTLQRVTLTAGRPSSLPTEIPTTIEGIDAKTMERSINATDAEDALKYLPSLLVRKRYIGDYNHAVLATRASGTGNSARSMVYADGILLSNLLGNGAGFTPRWGLVTPEEIERVDVLYGPFSAAYAGNSVGAVVDYITRMPTQFEAHVKAQAFTQDFKLFNTDKSYSGHQTSASIGDKNGPWSWWINVNEADSNGQPLVFANRLVSAGVPVTASAIPVSGAVLDKNPKNQDWLMLGTTTQYHTLQDHAKVKLAYDISPTIRASYTFGYWHNSTDGNVESYLRDAAGNAVYTGNVAINGRQYTLTPADFTPNKNVLEHLTHGFDVKSNTKGTWDWEIAASLYDYNKDILRSWMPSTASATSAANPNAGRITDMAGTGWNTVALKGIWRPQDAAGHTVEFGYQREAYKLRTSVFDTANWTDGAASGLFSGFNGDTQLQSLYAQDAWRINQQWKTILGGRFEQWRADNGSIASKTTVQPFGTRDEHYFSPKAALSYHQDSDWTYKASVGRAVRMPTVSELYQGSLSGTNIVNNDPNLKPEKSWTSELTAERSLNNGAGILRATFFHERTKDALYSQVNAAASSTVTTIQNVDDIRTNGIELAYQASDAFVRGLDLTGSLTYTDSEILRNDKFPASVGKQQPRVPNWRANFVATYRQDDKLSYTLGARYSGKQYGTLDNSDPNGNSYTGFGSFFVADVRVRYQLARQWTGSIGIDNLNNAKYWAFHPYTQRTVMAELKFDY